MHAFLIVYSNSEEKENKISSLIKSFKSKRYNAVVNKIDDVRELISFTKLGQKEPIVIVIEGIENASIETLNALLKNLEEPQENIKFLLTTKTLANIPQTIISRCEIIKTKITQEEDSVQKTSDFITGNLSSKLSFISNIKTRDEAQEFAQTIITGSHSLLVNGKSLKKYSHIVTHSTKLLSAIKKNGNINLHLLKFVINI